jgi:hypothetical protein
MLTNGTFVIAYQDQTNSDYGTFVIHDPDGAEVRGPTIFNQEQTSYISVSPLLNGHFVIAYSNFENYGQFIMYNAAGDVVVDEQSFHDGQSDYISTTTLHNGNFVIAYRHGADNGGDRGAFKIYEPDGTFVFGTDFTDVIRGNLNHISAETLSNGNFIIAFNDLEFNYGKYVMYDQSGSEVGFDIYFSFAAVADVSTAALTNGNFIIAFNDTGNLNYGTFMIFDSSKEEVKSKTVFNSAVTGNISAAALDNGNFVIAYEDAGNNDTGSFVMFDSGGTEVKSETNFNHGSFGTPSISTSALGNRNFVIAYQNDLSDERARAFRIYAELHLELEKVSSNEVRLWNHTDETLELMLSVDQ